MDSTTAWLRELDRPTERFFPSLAARIQECDGLRSAVCEAIEHLTVRVDWEGYLPQMPHGLLGLRAVFRLRGYLSEPSFHRLLATQLHAFAHEPRAAGARALQRIGRGSGHWPNLEMALRDHRPAIAWGEARGLAHPAAADFRRLLPLISGDMANVGHKAIAAHHLGDLFERLERPSDVGQNLLALAAWIAAAEPADHFWNTRVRKRLEGMEVIIPPEAARLDGLQHAEGAREICELGLVAALDAFTGHLKRGETQGDLLAILVRAAAEKQLDARRDLEGKTSWNFVYLASLPAMEGPEPWGQAAALVNFFPTDDPEERMEAIAPQVEPSDPESALMEAVLDAEPGVAMGLVTLLRATGGDEAVLRALAEAASRNDPGFNHSHPILALAAAADLLPRLTEGARAIMLQALAKSLANSQGSDELGRLADRALRARG
jgi:hypothetical protein